MPSGHEEELYAIKFCFKLGKYATETYRMLQIAFEESRMNRASGFEWHKEGRESVRDDMKCGRSKEVFKEGRESVRDDERCGRSKEVNRPELIDQRVRVRVTMLRF